MKKAKRILTMGLAVMAAVSAMNMSVLAEELSTDIVISANEESSNEPSISFDENGNLILPEGWLSEEEMQERYGYTVVHEGVFASEAGYGIEPMSVNFTGSYNRTSVPASNAQSYYLTDYDKAVLSYTSKGESNVYPNFYFRASGISAIYVKVDSTDSVTSTSNAPTMYVIGTITKNGSTSTGIIASTTVPVGGSYSNTAVYNLSGATITKMYSTIANPGSTTRTGTVTFTY